VLLADEIVERLRAPLAGYDLVAHGKVFQFSVVTKEKNPSLSSAFPLTEN
jgi:hypothetical protein